MQDRSIGPDTDTDIGVNLAEIKAREGETIANLQQAVLEKRSGPWRCGSETLTLASSLHGLRVGTPSVKSVLTITRHRGSHTV